MNKNVIAVMKLPLVALGLSFFAGCIAGRDAPLALFAAALAFFAICLIKRRWRLWAVGFLLGMLCISVWECFYAQPLRQLAGTQQRLQCHIMSQSYSSERFSVSKAFCVIDGKPAVITLTGQYSAEPGSDIEVLAEICQEQQSGFNYADGALLSAEAAEVYSSTQPSGLFHWSDAVRTAAESRLDTLGGDEAELAKGLLLGDTSDFPLKLRRDIKYSGVNYMCAVSGAHITLCIAILTELFCRRRGSAQAYVAIVSALILAVLFDFSPSVMRAGFMLIICRCGVLLRRQPVTLNSLCAALFIMTVFTPNAAFDPALQMSALGVFGAAELGTALNRLRHYRWERFRLLAKLKEAALMALGAMACIAPVSVSLFGGISLAEVPASVALSPFFTLAVLFGLLFLMSGVPLTAVPLKWALSCFRGILGFFGDIPGAWRAMDFDGAVILAAFIALLLIIGAFVTDHSKLALQCSGLCAVLLITLSICHDSDRKYTGFISDGKSGAAVICERNEAAVTISGSGNFSRELFDFLTDSGITRLRLINAPQLDSSGLLAMQELTELFPADTFLCPQEQLPGAEKCVAAREFGMAEDILLVDGVSYAMLKAGDDTPADIAVYYGYKNNIPPTGAALPLYASARQNALPENGVNIYDNELRIVPQGITQAQGE